MIKGEFDKKALHTAEKLREHLKESLPVISELNRLLEQTPETLGCNTEIMASIRSSVHVLINVLTECTDFCEHNVFNRIKEHSLH